MKPLEELEKIKAEVAKYYDFLESDFDFEIFKHLERELKEGLIAKKLLEIIKEKRVNVDLLMTVKDADTYNGFACHSGEDRKLTQQKFDFLKEVLKEYAK